MATSMTAALEQHLRPRELAKLWSVSPKTIIRRFRNEPGVAHLGTALLIPASVACRVYARLSGPEGLRDNRLQATAASGNPCRVISLGDANGRVPKQTRNIAYRYATKKRSNREGVTQAMRSAV